MIRFHPGRFSFASQILQNPVTVSLLRSCKCAVQPCWKSKRRVEWKASAFKKMRDVISFKNGITSKISGRLSGGDDFYTESFTWKVVTNGKRGFLVQHSDGDVLSDLVLRNLYFTFKNTLRVNHKSLLTAKKCYNSSSLVSWKII